MNRVVSEAFLHFFVKTVGHYGSYVKYGRGGGEGVFEKRSFYKAIDSKTTRHFVKKFIQTQTFDLFMQEVEQRQPGPQQGEESSLGLKTRSRTSEPERFLLSPVQSHRHFSFVSVAQLDSNNDCEHLNLKNVH